MTTAVELFSCPFKKTRKQSCGFSCFCGNRFSISMGCSPFLPNRPAGVMRRNTIHCHMNWRGQQITRSAGFDTASQDKAAVVDITPMCDRRTCKCPQVLPTAERNSSPAVVRYIERSMVLSRPDRCAMTGVSTSNRANAVVGTLSGTPVIKWSRRRLPTDMAHATAVPGPRQRVLREVRRSCSPDCGQQMCSGDKAKAAVIAYDPWRNHA